MLERLPELCDILWNIIKAGLGKKRAKQIGKAGAQIILWFPANRLCELRLAAGLRQDVVGTANRLSLFDIGGYARNIDQLRGDLSYWRGDARANIIDIAAQPALRNLPIGTHCIANIC